MLAHHLLPGGDGKLIPVFVLAALFVHRIEAEIAAGRNGRPDPTGHRLALLGELFLYGCTPFGRARLEALFGQTAVQMDRGFIQPKLDHRDVRGRGLKKIAQPEPCDLQLCLVHGIKGRPKVDKHEVAFMTQEGKESGLFGALRFHGAKGLHCVVQNFVLSPGGYGPPVRPAHAKHLVEYGRAFKGERYGGDVCGLRFHFSTTP